MNDAKIFVPSHLHVEVNEPDVNSLEELFFRFW